MNEKYYLCTVRYDAQQHCEVIQSRSKGYSSVDELLKAATPWLEKNLGKKFFIQKYHI